MTVVVEDLDQPKGELELAFFPEEAVDKVGGHQRYEDRLKGYIADGEAKAAYYDMDDLDAGTLAWAYYRAFTAIGTRLLVSPRSADIESHGSRRYEQAQSDGFFALAAKWRDAFDLLIPPLNAPNPVGVPTASVKSLYEW